MIFIGFLLKIEDFLMKIEDFPMAQITLARAGGVTPGTVRFYIIMMHFVFKIWNCVSVPRLGTHLLVIPILARKPQVGSGPKRSKYLGAILCMEQTAG